MSEIIIADYALQKDGADIGRIEFCAEICADERSLKHSTYLGQTEATVEEVVYRNGRLEDLKLSQMQKTIYHEKSRTDGLTQIAYGPGLNFFPPSVYLFPTEHKVAEYYSEVPVLNYKPEVGVFIDSCSCCKDGSRIIFMKPTRLICDYNDDGFLSECIDVATRYKWVLRNLERKYI